MNKKKKIIILGASGFLGGHVYRILNKNKFYKTVKASSSGGQNFLDLNKTQQFIFRTKPDVIINCASYGGSVHHVMKNTRNLIPVSVNVKKTEGGKVHVQTVNNVIRDSVVQNVTNALKIIILSALRVVQRCV